LARIIGLDLGKARTGIAVTDPTQTIVSPVGTIKAKNEDDLTSNIKIFVNQYKPESVVVGIPRSMDGSTGNMAKWAEKFRRQLEKELDIPVKGWDERMSTVSAKRILRENTKSDTNNYGDDAVSAAVILESYMAYHNRKI
jgi:putative Holliday junction resolvase